MVRPWGTRLRSLAADSVVRRGSGGAESWAGAGDRDGRAGSAGLAAAPTETTGRVWLRLSVVGRPGGGGGGGFLALVSGAVKFFCLLRAAIRSARV